MRIAITCGYRTSLHAVALIHRLTREGHQVALCLRVRVLSPARVRFYLRQLGMSGFQRKLLNRLFPQQASRGALQNDETTPMLEYLREHGIASRSTTEACARIGVREVVVGSLNHPDVIELIRRLDVELIVYAGGGILNHAFLNAAPRGVLNTHGGPLPQFRGMNAGEWALFHGLHTAVTAHLVSREVDMGPILFQQAVPPDAWSRGVAYGRGMCTRSVVDANVEAVRRIAEGQVVPQPQRRADGRTFAVMAPPLIEVLERWIRQGRTPVRSPDDFRFQPTPLDV